MGSTAATFPSGESSHYLEYSASFMMLDTANSVNPVSMLTCLYAFVTTCSYISDCRLSAAYCAMSVLPIGFW